MAPARKPAAKRPAKTPADKGAGRNIPPAPVGAMAAIAAAAPAPDPAYRFEPAGQEAQAAAFAEAQIAADPVKAARDAELARMDIPDGLTWIDEYTPLGRRIGLVRGGDGEPVITHEEIVPHGAPEALAHAARARLSSKFVVA